MCSVSFSVFYTVFTYLLSRFLFTMVFSKKIFDAHIRHEVSRPCTAVPGPGPLVYGLVVGMGPGLIPELPESVFLHI